MGRGPHVPMAGDTGAKADETAPLLPSSAEGDSRSGLDHADEVDEENQPTIDGSSGKEGTRKFLNGFIAILLIGVLVSQADTSIVLVTYGQISSELNDFQSGSWLMTSYMLAQCIAQPLYGKLSDIFGRKCCLQASYMIFVIGTMGSGLAKSMSQIISARAVQGCGGAGMVCVVAILLTDLVPVHEVALYRSYVNVIQTIGRSCGGAVGGYLAQVIGWRWVFLGQCPLVLVALWLVNKKLPDITKRPSNRHSTWDKLRRVDIAGAISMSLSIVFSLLILDTGGQRLPWDHPIIIGAAAIALASGTMFVLIENHWAQEPIFPLRLITQYPVVNSYTLIALQNLTQIALMVTVPLYWQVTKNASPAAAGFYLIPAIIGNTLGGLLTGRWIMRYRRYKLPIVVASVNSMFTFASIIIYWRGNTSPLESLLIFSGGFGTGIAHSAVFVSLANGVADEDIAIASSGFYLSGNIGGLIGGVLGVSAASAVHQVTLRRGLLTAFKTNTNCKEIVRRALQDIRFVQNANERLRRLMLPAYIASFQAVFYMGLACAALVLVSGLLVREHRLREK
ncbi:MFS general substrate transporter [Aspergillus ruber CBS 135680]|uniref:MFS general substrate transporter n=1 Tax=Aspergillus ruber (strain CBS 135680) TaxID=1388766 RepID=A0A017SDV4_ASPRC|nr:MFS general substrate transporter [Aspergillus ruber CBS 135680]EYE95188.1 MFS general substrate transporter [Aspergillus ruber CBS 135680]